METSDESSNPPATFARTDSLPAAISPTVPAKLPPQSRSALVTGGGIGGALAAFAQTLKEPFKTWVVIIAPAVASGITAAWPRVLEWAGRRGQVFVVQHELRGYVRRQQKRLKKESLSSEQQKQIEQNIQKAQKAIIDRDFEFIQDYLK